VPSYRSVLCLVHRDGSHATAPQLRELVPCHCTAAGKTLLAYRERWRESVLSAPLERHTDRTLVEPVMLLREVTRIRERGFGIDDCEYQTDVRSIAAPVFDRDGDAVAALAVSGTVDALPTEHISARAAVVRESAARLSEALHG
jgi:IclR family transcriptional regulator, acetate operon repressor